MERAIWIFLMAGMVFAAKAAPVGDTLYTVKVKAEKPTHRFTLYTGTGYRHASTITHSTYKSTRPMTLLNLQYGLSKRWSVGLVASHFSFESQRWDILKQSTTLGLGCKVDYALVHKDNFQLFLSTNLTNQHYRWEYSRLGATDGLPSLESEKFVQLTPGFNAGVNWFPVKWLGVFGQVGHGLSTAEGGLAFKF